MFALLLVDFARFEHMSVVFGNVDPCRSCRIRVILPEPAWVGKAWG